MSDQGDTLANKVKRIATGNAAEHILNILKAGLATAPFCGGIASLMTDYIPSGRTTRLEAFVKGAGT